MKTNSVRWGRVIVAGLLAAIIAFVVEGMLYGSMNGVYEGFGDLPYAKPVESVPAYLLQMLAGGAALTVLIALVYAIIQEGLPGQKQWQKGLAFGVMLLVLYALPTAFNTWMQIAQPVTLILVEAVNRTIGLLIQALVIAMVYGQPYLADQARKPVVI
ncbi:MAG: hypothetical protein GY832_41870 [Chloroflexi bacterium]|nr:hypothetical protein [Chloroflexota bacterium]